ncbi:MAG: helix-turn-helix domain-containing protein [Clostridia bacterium]|nr:helix-turn-helix domain-containing protein [Clostridia bacterium]
MENKKRIAVISSDHDLALFFELEAMACGCSVRVFSSPPQELSEFDFVVLDLAAGYCFAEEDSCQIAAVCRDGRKTEHLGFDYVWEWPISVQTVREAYENTVVLKKSIVESSVVNNILYFLSDPIYTVVYRNRTISLTQSEWLVLDLLAKAGGQIVDRAAISDLFAGTKGNLADVHICHLRKKLEAPFGIRLIETVRGNGYILKAKIVYL